MPPTTKKWKDLFLFSLGIFLASAICMKLMEPHFYSNGRLFTIIGLEISYGPEKIREVMSGLQEPSYSLLHFHLYFDFVFMAGAYLGIFSLCNWGAEYRQGVIRNLLRAFGYLQFLAWILDIIENLYLLSWLKQPDRIADLSTYHLVVASKWGLALAGLFLSMLFLSRKQRR